MAIKKLQNNYTTPEQSKRLMELGLPADSADCYHNRIAEKPFILSMPYSYSNWDDKDNPPLPCWSVGRLIEIYLLCSAYNFKYEFLAEEKPIDTIVSSIEYAIQELDFDFSKLEE